MGSFDYFNIPNQDECGSSAFIFDLRNSTQNIRNISWDYRLPKHIDFMMRLHEKVYKILFTNCDNNNFAMNDTGDGYLCVFWDKIHTITSMRIAIEIKEYLDLEIPKHNSFLNLDENTMFDYGFALHSGGCTIIRSSYKNENIKLNKDFIFGIVANTVSRLESLNKFYKEYKFLVTGNYKKNFKKQCSNKAITELFNLNKNFVSESLGRVDLRDGKKTGHYIYGLKNEFFPQFKKLIK